MRANNSKNEKIIPIKPETSTRLKAIKLQRIKVLERDGLREIEINKWLKIIPTPIATPNKGRPTTRPADKYLKPSKIITNNINK